MTPTTILMLSASAGTGHTRAAEALRAYAAMTGGELAAVHLDVLQFVTPLLRSIYTDVYNLLVGRAPGLWSRLYRATDRARPGGRAHKIRRWAERMSSRALLREVAHRRPDLIICTHFLPAEMLSPLRGSGALTCPVWVQVTDFDLHQMWVHDHIAGYFAPNDEVAFRLRERGIAAAAIHVTGIPIMPAFSHQFDRRGCARALRIEPQMMTVLLIGGGTGLGSVIQIAERLLALHIKFQIIALAGKSASTLAALRELAARHPGRLTPHGYTGHIERLMACSDLVVTKPGGLTTAESLAMGLPMIVIAPIPGQEEHNANFLLERGVALKAFDMVTLEYRIRYLMAHPAKLEDMRGKARALGRPEAARVVLDTVLAELRT
jgi:processive 1,2-diacylglycerol beta-glucosyltransferase